MRRLLGLAVIFLVLSVSVPSYGYFLIYNVTGTVKGVNNTAPASIAWKGYLVLDFNDSNDLIVDANLVMYGKDSGKHKVYVVLNENDSNGLLHTDLRSKGNYTVFNFWDYNEPFDFEGLIIGKGALKDIGFGALHKKWIASSIKGTAMVWEGMLLDADDDIAGTGTVSASLYTVATKAVNSKAWTQDQIASELIDILTTKGYVAAVLPTP